MKNIAEIEIPKVQELNSKIWNLSRLRSFLPLNTLLDIYKSLIQPKIDYAITIWGYTNEHNLERIQRLQNRAARVIFDNFDFVNTRGYYEYKTKTRLFYGITDVQKYSWTST